MFVGIIVGVAKRFFLLLIDRNLQIYLFIKIFFEIVSVAVLGGLWAWQHLKKNLSSAYVSRI